MSDHADISLLLGSVWVDAVDLDDRRALGKVSSDDDRNALHLPDLLDLVTSRGDLETLKDGLHLGLGEQPLLGGFDDLQLSRTLKNNLILIILVEQSLLIVDRAGSNLHLESVLFGVLLDLLEVLVVAVLCEPGNNVTLRPVDLEGVFVLVVDVVLQQELNEVTYPTIEYHLRQWASDRRAPASRY